MCQALSRSVAVPWELEIQILLGPHPRPTKSKLLGVGVQYCALSPPSDSDAYSRLQPTSLGVEAVENVMLTSSLHYS